MKKWIFRIMSLFIIFFGAILCGFTPYLNIRVNRLFDFRPLAIVLIVIGVFCMVADFVEDMIDTYKDNFKNKNK